MKNITCSFKPHPYVHLIAWSLSRSDWHHCHKRMCGSMSGCMVRFPFHELSVRSSIVEWKGDERQSGMNFYEYFLSSISWMHGELWEEVGSLVLTGKTHLSKSVVSIRMTCVRACVRLHSLTRLKSTSLPSTSVSFIYPPKVMRH